MIKLEIVANKVLEEDIVDILDIHGYGENFTCISPVFGRGRHGRRERSSVWPEENIIIMVYMKEDELRTLITDLYKLKKALPAEGFRAYIHKDTERVL